jgi:hypothetical protein
MVAVVAAGAVVLATPSLAPPKPPTELTSPQVVTQSVQLVARPETLTLAARAATAAASPEEIVSTFFQATVGRVIAGAGSGFLVGFFGAGALALQVFGRIPVVGTPIVQAIAITAGILGIPIGAVAGALTIVTALVSSLRSTSAEAVQRPAASSTTPGNVGDALQNVAKSVGGQVVESIGQVIAGAGGFAFAGFVGAGLLASGLMAIPAVGLAFAPLVPVAALTGAIVGAPIGAVVGALSVVKKWVTSAFPNLKASVPVRPSAAGRKAVSTPPQRASQPGARSNRDTAKPSAHSVRKAAGPQQRSDTAKAGSGRDRDAAAKRAGRH